MTLTRFLLLCMTVFASAAFAQTAAPLVIDAEWLSSHLNDRNLVILHVGSKSEYAAAHIPGARYMTMDDISLPAGKKPERLTWERLYRQFGPNPEKADDKITVRDFRKDVLRELRKLKLAWPALSFGTPVGCLEIRPCPPSINPKSIAS